MLPSDELHKIRSVTIHHFFAYIYGFSFFDKDGAILLEIGSTESCWSDETVDIAENEVIVGVVAKLYSDRKPVFSDFQFKIA